MRSSCRDIVEAVKGVKHLNKNLSRHMNSSNQAIRDQYDRIRIRLGEVLRLVAALDVARPDPFTALSLDDAKLELLQLDDGMTKEVAQLIRMNRIPASAVTSLLNDAHYATEVGLNLISALQVLVSVGRHRERAALSGVTLGASELRTVDETVKQEGDS